MKYKRIQVDYIGDKWMARSLLYFLLLARMIRKSVNVMGMGEGIMMVPNRLLVGVCPMALLVERMALLVERGTVTILNETLAMLETPGVRFVANLNHLQILTPRCVLSLA